MAGFRFKQFPVSLPQFQLHGQKFFVRSGLKPGVFVSVGAYDSVGVIDADLRAGVDAVLALPKLDQPGFVAVIKIDRFALENHLS